MNDFVPVQGEKASSPRSASSVLESLDQLWSGYKNKWRRLLSKQVITELTLRASFDLDLLAPNRIANQIPKGTIPDCASCDDICCRGIENLVSLRLRDIAVLMDIGRTDLVTTRKPRFPQFMMESRPAMYELMGSELWLTLPVLRQVGEHRICAALNQDMTCSLYPDWPLSCERFPYSLQAARKHVVWGTRCAFKKQSEEHASRSEALFVGAIDTYNERIRDAVLLAHARESLDELGIGQFLSDPHAPIFEDPLPRLPIV